MKKTILLAFSAIPFLSGCYYPQPSNIGQDSGINSTTVLVGAAGAAGGGYVGSKMNSEYGAPVGAAVGGLAAGGVTAMVQSRKQRELAEAAKTKGLLGDLIIAGGLGRPIPQTSRNDRKIAGAILACWSLVHGLTLLLADGLVGPRKRSGALCDSLVQGILDGLAAELPVLPPGTWVGPQVPESPRPATSNV